MAGHECYHCKQWVEAGEPHDCWTTTEAALTRDLSEDLQDAWVRLRETAAEFGDQRIYASHHSIMFSRKSCYFFVRPKRNFLELCIFLGRTLKAPQIKRATPSSQTKIAHLLQIKHRDEVEAPITEWLREAYDMSETLKAARAVTPGRKLTSKPAARAAAPRKQPKTLKASKRLKAPTRKTRRAKRTRKT